MKADEQQNGPVAYLTSQYPATSHTFILREVEAVRAAGVDVRTFTVRPPSTDELTDPAIAAEAATTVVILAQGMSKIVAAHARMLVRRPGNYLRAIGLALRHRPPGLRGFALALAHFAEAGMLAVELERQGVSHLHNHFANSAATVGLIAARMIDLPWSFMIHGISESDYPAGVTLPDKVRAARFVACASWFGRAQAMRMVEPEHWDKIGVVRCGLRLDRLPKPADDRFGRNIICVGRLSPEKGQAGLIESFSRLLTVVPDARLNLIGSGPDEAQLRALVARLGLEGVVNFAGRCSEADTLDAIAAADVLVMASFMEGLPIVLMEAMALGAAVVAPRLAGVPELVDDGRTGLLFTPSNWQELEARLVQLLTDDLLRQRLSHAALATIEREFDVARSATQLVALFAKDRTASGRNAIT